MKDAILNGTGDSRYLKSKIPTGTTWEQALAMLNAGTFPVDLNGINSEGFQQLGTPLNKANLLKDAVVSKLGLTGDKTPNDMFGVLADVGNLHVWRKTVTTTEEVPAVPAGYTLGVEETSFMIAGTSKSYDTVAVTMTFSIGGAVATAADGTVSLTDINTSRKTVINKHNMYSNLIDYIKGKFVSVVVSGSDNFGIDGIWYVPSDATLELRDAYGAEQTYSYEVYISKAQRVTGYPYTPAIPASTSVTYPVSTNRNAYQEGSDAKPAGYVLGDTEKIILGDYSSGTNQYINYSDSVSVTDTGTVSLVNSSGTVQGNKLGEGNNFTTLKGKFIKTSRYGSNVIFFVPMSSTLTTAVVDGDTKFSADCQPVTGYAATPAGTVIEYLGCLGDKARVQVLSYVGTGTQGASNPCSITADFPMKMVVYAFAENLTNSAPEYIYQILDWVSTSYSSKQGLGSDLNGTLMGKKSADSKTLSWYIDTSYTDQAWVQLNESGKKYTFLAIG